MQTFNKILKMIRHELPDFFLSSIKKAGEGDNYSAFLINEKYIFRFAKTKRARLDLKKEIEYLPQISASVNIAVPKLKFISAQLDFAGHRKIPGQSLSRDIYKHLNKKEKEKAIKSLGTFLNQLHKIDYEKPSNNVLDTMDYKAEYSSDFEISQKIVFPNISGKHKELIIDLFTRYLNNEDNFQYKPALIHNDFSVDHILFRKKKNEISGIIDFGDLAIGDPDYDLMYLYDAFGKGFIKKLLHYYPHPYSKKLISKLIFFSLANKIQILNNAIPQGDECEIKEGYQNLKKWLRDYRNM